MAVSAPTQPNTDRRVSPRALAGCLGRFGRFGCFMTDGNLWLYEMPKGSRIDNPQALMSPLAPVERVPDCYLRLRDVRRSIEEARACIAERMSLIAGVA